MAKGITIKVTRIIETRDRRPGERGHKIWTGTKWVSVDAVPRGLTAGMKAADFPPLAVTTTIAFPPSGTVTIDALRYRAGLMKEMQKIGVVR